jgi:small subunit ribosomal protein S1
MISLLSFQLVTLKKRRGKKLKKGDTADFKVIEFNKENSRVDHTAIFLKKRKWNQLQIHHLTLSTNAPAATLGEQK